MPALSSNGAALLWASSVLSWVWLSASSSLSAPMRLASRTASVRATESAISSVRVRQPVADQVGAMGHRQPQLGHQRGGDLHLLQIAAVPGGIGDDVSIAGIGLGFTTVGGRRLVHSATRCVLHLLPTSGQQSKDEPGHGARDIDCPDHLIGALQDTADRLENGGLVVDHLR